MAVDRVGRPRCLKPPSGKTRSFGFRLMETDWVHHSLTWEHLWWGVRKDPEKKLVEGREVIAQRGSTLSRASCRPQQLDTQRLSDLLSFEQTAGNEDGLLNILCFSRDYAAGQLLGSPRPKPLAFDLGRKQQRSSLSPGERAWWSRLALRLRALRSSPSSLGGLRPVSKQLQFPCVSNQDKYLTSHLPGV